MAKKESSSSSKKTRKKSPAKQANVVASDDFRIIGIGTSAGGLEALKAFFDSVPTGYPHSFVIVQHLSDDYRSLMAELLAKNTQMPIHEVKDNMLIEAGNIYLIPSKKNMTLEKNRLHLVDKPVGHGLNLPIDIFFNSMARELGDKAVGIVLTGTGSDGANGVRNIKEAGGMVMVQSPETAKFEGMPRSAVDTGLADYILPIEQMPEELLTFFENNEKLGDFINEKVFYTSEETLIQVLNHLKKVTNFDFLDYKRPTLLRRISRRMSVTKSSSLKEYLDFLKSNPEEAQILVKGFLIGVTKFFRDQKAYELMLKKYIPYILENKKGSTEPLKVWSVGCSSGEEPYSLAIVIHEVLEKLGINIEVKIFATDLDREALDIASRGLYSASIVADVGTERLNKYFINKGEHYQVKQVIRKMILFSYHNCLTDPPFNKTSLISCRNLLIYFQPKLQAKVLNIFQYSLNKDGILFLGPSESIGEMKNVFEEQDRRWKVYKNVNSTKNYPTLDKASSGSTLASPAYSRMLPASTHKRVVSHRLADVLNDTLSEVYNVVSIYVDESLDIIHAFGNLNKFVSLPESGFSVNLLKMVPDNLSLPISNMIRKATKLGEVVKYRGVKLQKANEVLRVNIIIKPFKIERADATTYFLVMLQEEGSIPKADLSEIDYSSSPGIEEEVAELQKELKETKESLQITIEELETSNEELQATNEELLAANEELQSTNEELQSVNEELHTVNAEHQSKIQEMEALNSDMDNLLKSTEMGTVFLDKNLKIRWFTPAIKQQFNLLISDVGRSISHFTSHIPNDNLIENAEYVLRTGKSVEMEVITDDGKTFLRRTLPYLDSYQEPSGVVITFVDLTNIKQMKDDLESTDSKFSSVLDVAPIGIMTSGSDSKVLSVNKALIDLLGYKEGEIVGERISSLFATGYKQFFSNNRKKKATELDTFKSELYAQSKSGERISVEVMERAMVVGKNRMWVTIISDGTERTQARKQLKDLNETLEAKVSQTSVRLQDKELALDTVLESAMAGYWDWNIKEKSGIISASLEKLLGYTDRELPQDETIWKRILHKDDYEGFITELNLHINSGNDQKPFEIVSKFLTKQGSEVWVLTKGKVVSWNDKGEAERMIGTQVNVTQLKEAEEKVLKINEQFGYTLAEVKRKNTELEQFAYVATHDLRTPLINLGHLFALLEVNNLEDRNRKVVDKMRLSINQMSETLHDLIDILAINSDKSARYRVTKFKDVLEHLKSGIEVMINNSNATIETDFKVPGINYITGHLNSIFQNLVTNAIRYKHPDRDPDIKIRTYKLSDYICIAVSDNGLGIDLSKNRSKLFGMFKPLNEGTSGRGLGLYILKSQVEMMGGKIEVESEPGVGSTFTVLLKDQS